MTAFSHQETSNSWRPQRREPAVRLYLTGAEGDTADLIGARVAGLPLELSLVPLTDWIDPTDLNCAAVGVIQVDEGTPASMKRFQKLAETSEVPLIVAAYDPPLAFVRSLLRNGAADVLPLPLDLAELESSLQVIQQERPAAAREAEAAYRGRVVTMIKASGGVGATALLAQLAARFASNEGQHGREACLLDLDLQFGDAAFQLGVQHNLSIAELIEAGSRLDGALVRSASAKHDSGLHIIASPKELMPLEGHVNEDLIQIVDTAAREFGTAFVDLPANWTNWSLSLLAQSDLVLLVSELNVPSLHRAKRQLDLIRSQGLGDLEIRLVINRFEKSQLRTIRSADVREALGCDISYTIANDPVIMRTASDRGVTIDQVKRKSGVSRDIDALDAAIAAILGMER